MIEWVCAINLIREKLRFEKNKDDNILNAKLNKSDGQTNINKYKETVLLISSKSKQNIDDQPNFQGSWASKNCDPLDYTTSRVLYYVFSCLFFSSEATL